MPKKTFILDGKLPIYAGRDTIVTEKCEKLKILVVFREPQPCSFWIPLQGQKRLQNHLEWVEGRAKLNRSIEE